jgi:hypothetical protein
MQRDVLGELARGLEKLGPLTRGEALEGYLTLPEGDNLRSERAALRVAVGSAIIRTVEQPPLAWLLINGSSERALRETELVKPYYSGLDNPRIRLEIDSDDQVRTNLVIVGDEARYKWEQLPQKPVDDLQKLLGARYPNTSWSVDAAQVYENIPNAANLGGPLYKATGISRLTGDYFRDNGKLLDDFAGGLVGRIELVENWFRSKAVGINAAEMIRADIGRLKRGLDILVPPARAIS